MPSLLSQLMRPERTPPAPVAVDLGRVLLVGTGAWLVALVVTAVLAATGVTPWTPVVVCAVGAVIGLGGVLWARTRPAPSAPRDGTGTVP